MVQNDTNWVLIEDYVLLSNIPSAPPVRPLVMLSDLRSAQARIFMKDGTFTGAPAVVHISSTLLRSAHLCAP